jgi:broad specificity phosphatase PhoE
MMLSRLAPLALAATLVATSAAPTMPRARSAAAAPPTIVLVVRHGEKAAQPAGDPPLSSEGTRRAESLAEVARGLGVSAIITTQFARTRLTAKPTADALGIEPLVISAGALEPHARAIADSIRHRYAGKSVLVVGHSNTVPAIVAALGGTRVPELCDAEYDALFTVVLGDEGTRVVRSRYGPPSDVSSCERMR